MKKLKKDCQFHNLKDGRCEFCAEGWEGCDNCGWKTKKLHRVPQHHPITWLCKICFSTFSGNCVYQLERSTNDVLKTLSYIANMLLEKIERLEQRDQISNEKPIIIRLKQKKK